MATTLRQFRNLVGGEWVDAASGGTFDSTSPANGDHIGTFPKSGADDVDRAVEAAKEAFESWRLVPAPKRGELLFRFAQLLVEHKAELTDLMTREMGKVKAEAGGDVQEAIDMSYYMGGEGRRLFGQTTPSELRDKFQMSVRMPIGVIGVITPWNFPIAIPSWKIAPALVAGNTVVFKPATDTPALGQRFVELLAEAGVPSGARSAARAAGTSKPMTGPTTPPTTTPVDGSSPSAGVANSAQPTAISPSLVVRLPRILIASEDWLRPRSLNRRQTP